MTWSDLLYSKYSGGLVSEVETSPPLARISKGNTYFWPFRRYSAKIEKNRKKILTKRERSGILTKLSDTTGREARAFEADLKRIRKKHLTNGKQRVTIAKLSSAKANASSVPKMKLEKISKKVLDKRKAAW